MGHLVFVLGPRRVQLNAEDVTDLHGWFKTESSPAGAHLRSEMSRSIRTREAVVVTEDDLPVLKDVLEIIAIGEGLRTSGLRDLLEAAREPILH